MIRRLTRTWAFSLDDLQGKAHEFAFDIEISQSGILPVVVSIKETTIGSVIKDLPVMSITWETLFLVWKICVDLAEKHLAEQWAQDNPISWTDGK